MAPQPIPQVTSVVRAWNTCTHAPLRRSMGLFSATGLVKRQKEEEEEEEEREEETVGLAPTAATWSNTDEVQCSSSTVRNPSHHRATTSNTPSTRAWGKGGNQHWQLGTGLLNYHLPTLPRRMM